MIKVDLSLRKCMEMVAGSGDLIGGMTTNWRGIVVGARL